MGIRHFNGMLFSFLPTYFSLRYPLSDFTSFPLTGTKHDSFFCHVLLQMFNLGKFFLTQLLLKGEMVDSCSPAKPGTRGHAPYLNTQ